MKNLPLVATICLSLISITPSHAEHHMDDLMSDGVDHQNETTETIVTKSVSIPLADKPKSTINLPKKSDSFKTVMQKFGNADKKYPPKGKPPITRWDYPGFSVYFESGYVIHTVRRSK